MGYGLCCRVWVSLFMCWGLCFRVCVLGFRFRVLWLVVCDLCFSLRCFSLAKPLLFLRETNRKHMCTKQAGFDFMFVISVFGL